MKSNSWVIVRKGTLDSVLETWLSKVVAAINTDKYEALTAHDYLCKLNASIKSARNER